MNQEDNQATRDNVDILEDRIPRELLTLLLSDHTTGGNIIWATDIGGHLETEQMTVGAITGENGLTLRPRVRKSEEERRLRTKKRAEVFTPSWVCNEQLNAADSLWFGLPPAPGCGSPFNIPSGTSWIPTTDAQLRRAFTASGRDWHDYVAEDRMEMCCGEGPYLISRYDVVSEREIPVRERIGILDRKLRVINAFARPSNTSREKWQGLVRTAFQHTYAFEWQGDNLLLTREAMLYTLVDHIRLRNIEAVATGRASAKLLDSVGNDFINLSDYDFIREVCDIITWNIWQMDGLTGCPPYVRPASELKKFTLQLARPDGAIFSDIAPDIPQQYCRIMDWNENKITTYAEVYAEALKAKRDEQ